MGLPVLVPASRRDTSLRRKREEGDDDDEDERLRAAALTIGALRKWLYGLRGSPAAWQSHFAYILMEEVGFDRCDFEPCLFYNPRLQVYILIHVDDMHLCGPDKEMKLVIERLSAELVMKSQGPFRPGDTYKFLGLTRKIEVGRILLIPNKSYTEETSHSLG